jgi:exodeoxyribonuclease V alpha subunit
MKVIDNQILKDDDVALSTEDVSEDEMKDFLANTTKGFGKKKAKVALETHGKEEIMNMLENEPEKLLDLKGMKEKTMKKMVDSWESFKRVMKGLPPSDG